jgi:hyaluronoglucosaminidase
LWDNYPVNDALVMNELFLGPYAGREAGLGRALDGILVNPMLQPEATKIPLWTVGRFFRDDTGYDADAAWEEALAVLTGGEGTAIVRLIAQQFRSHPFIGDADESVDFASAADRFWQSRSPQAEAELRRVFRELGAAGARLDSEVSNQALSAELREPTTKLALYGEAGLLALDLLAEHARGNAIDAAELSTKLAETSAIRWLVGGNTSVPAPLAALIASRAGRPADVFGDFFARVSSELGL